MAQNNEPEARAASMSQAGLDAHFRTFFRCMASDFRAFALTTLVVRKLDRNRNVLDLGCGSCVLTRRLLSEGMNVVSVDPSLEMVAMAREFLISEGFSEANVQQLDIAGCTEHLGTAFDQVACLDVIEHIADDAEAVAGIARLIKAGGKLVLTVPAIPALYGPKDVRLGHYRRYSRGPLLDLLRAQGFEIKSCRYWNMIGVPITWLWVKIFRREVDESARRTGRTRVQGLLNGVLRGWFLGIENHVRPPTGLTLIVEAVRRPSG